MLITSLGNYSPPARTQHREHAQHSRGAFLPCSIQQTRVGRRRRARSPCTLLQPEPGAGAAFLGSSVPAARLPLPEPSPAPWLHTGHGAAGGLPGTTNQGWHGRETRSTGIIRLKCLEFWRADFSSDAEARRRKKPGSGTMVGPQQDSKSLLKIKCKDQ